MIETYLLEHLLAFHKFGTLSAAAEQLHLAQPSVSRSMQKLESELGVTLLIRSKNRVELNESGKLAAEYAKRILEKEEEMIRHIRAFDRANRTIMVGSCAPGPLMFLFPKITSFFSEMTISSDIVEEEVLLQGLKRDDYQLIIAPKHLESEEFYCQKYLREHLYLSVNNFHPAATYKSITFAEMDGQNFIMYAKVGIWEDILREKMPHAKLYKQADLDAVGEIASASDLPSFSTNITQQLLPSRVMNRVNIPFSDEEAHADFYIACKQSDKKRFSALLNLLKQA